MASIEELSIDIISNLGNADKALDRLSASLSKMSAALGGFDTGKFSAIGNGVGNLAVSMKSASGIKAADFNRISNGIDKLNRVDVSNLAAVGRGLSSLLVGFQGLSGVANGARSLATAASSIAKLGGVQVQRAIVNMHSVGPAVAALNNAFAGGITPLPNISEFVSSVAKLGGKATTNAITNLPQLADSLTQTMNTLSKAPKVSQNVISLTNALANLASQGNKARSASNGLATAMDRVSTSGRRASTGVLSFGASIRSMLGAAGIMLGIRQIIQFGKSCIELGSSMTETQNVVDVAFGSMASKANAFAKTTATQFGVSELSAKQYSGVLMSMYRSLGVAQENAANMAMGLTGRAGDIASFYNISTDNAYYKIRSAVSGETEPMKQLGVNMNVANLNAFALSNGFGKLYNKMTLAEQAMLRYEYIMATTDQTAGDFVRTQGSFANQLRILQLQFQQFSTTMGQGFINIIVHVVRALNTLLAYLQTAANAFRALTALIFGDNSAQAGGGIAGGIEDAEDAAGGLAGNLGGAAQAAKDLANATSGIDELNIISPNDKGGTGGGGAGGGADVDYGDLNDGTSFVDDLNGKLSELLKLLEPTTVALKKLWDEGFSKLKDFTFGTLQDFYDKFLKPVGLWTLSEAGLPRFINITNDMLNRINWTRLQDSLRGFYEQLGNIAILTFTTLLDFYEEFLVPIAVWTIGDALPRLLDVLTNLSKRINWDGLIGSLKNLYGALSYFAIGIGDGLVLFIEGIARVLTPAISSAVEMLSAALNGIANAVKLIPEDVLIGLGGAIGGLATAILAFTGVTAAIAAIAEIKTALSGLLAAAAANPILLLVGGLGALAGVLLTMQQSWDKQMADEFIQFQKDIGSNNSELEAAADAIGRLSENSGKIISNAESDAKQLDTLKDAYFRLADQTHLTAKEQNNLREYAQQLIDKCPELRDKIDMTTGRYTTQKDEIQKVIEKQQEYMRVMAYDQVVSDYANALAKANVELAVSERQYDVNQEKVMALRDIMADMSNNFTDSSVIMEKYRDTLEDCGVSMDNDAVMVDSLIQRYDFYKKELQESTSRQAELKVGVENATIANEVAQEALEGHKQKLGELIETTNQADFSQIVIKASAAIDSLGGVFIDGKQVVGTDAVALYNEIISAYGTIDQDFYDLGNRGIIQFGVGGKAGIADTVPTMTDELWAQIEAEYNSKGVQVAYEGGQVIITGVADGGKAGASNAATEISDTVTDALQSDEITQKMLGAGQYAGDQYNQGIAEKKQEGYEAGKSNAVAAISGANDGFIENAASSQEPVKKWADLTREYYAGQNHGGINAETFKGFADDSTKGFNQEIKTKTKDSQEPMETWAKSDREWFSGQDETKGINEMSWSKFAENIIKAFNDKINESFIESQIPVETWAQNVREWFWGDSDINGVGGMYDSFYNMAKRINEGFAEGIHKFSYLAKDAIRQWARDAMKEAEEEFEIESPSKRFYRMAAYDIEGFNNAFSDLGGTTQSAVNKWASAINAPSIGLGFNIDDSYTKYVPNYGQDFSIGYQTIMGKVGGQVSVSSDGKDNIIVEAINNVIDGKLMPVLRNLEKLDNLESMPEQKELLQEIADKDTMVSLNGRKVNEEIAKTTRRGGFKFRPI
ncbi:hypothetical protein [Clostridium sp. FS41]|uniref:hypothetical protein n=1 Tax=Clostridium sp. FS41 TaxID=1609975 RepID=UPI00061E23D4|nr:hypothetical protein [Clostridium sp. FS41]KJJ65437.1 chromosome partition protein Smc [Clostridium sp. FS41]